MIEEALFFPGKRVDNDDDDEIFYGTRDDASSIITRQDSTSSNKRRTSFSVDDAPTLRLEDVPEKGEPTADNAKERDAEPTPKGRSTMLPLATNGSVNGVASGASRPSSPVRSTRGSAKGHRSGGGGSYDANDPHGSLLKPAGGGGGRHHVPSQAPTPSVYSSSSSTSHGTLVAPHSRSMSRPPLSQQAHASAMGLMYASAGSLVGSMGYLAYQDPVAETMKRQRKLDAVVKKNRAAAAAGAQGTRRTRPSPVLSSLMTKGPVDPRDHTLLQAVWEGMLDGRFVNGSPISLLTTYLEYHFVSEFLGFVWVFIVVNLFRV